MDKTELQIIIKEQQLIENVIAKGYGIADSMSPKIAENVGDYHFIINSVIGEYCKYDTEFNGSFLQFKAPNLSVAQVISLYADLQKLINGDDVVRVKNKLTDGKGHIIYAEKTNLTEEEHNVPSEKTIYEIIEALNKDEYIRVVDMKGYGDIIAGGEIVELIW